MRRRQLCTLLLIAGMLVAGNVCWAADGAQYVSDTIPDTMNAGWTYTPTVTMRNTGDTTWTNSPADYNFGPPNVGAPNPAVDWGGRVDSGTVAPTEEHTFTLNITPVLPGSYDCRWMMVHEGVAWFGDEVTKTINVVCAGLPQDEYFVNDTFDSYVAGALQPQGPPAGATVAAWNVRAGANTTQATVVSGGVTGNALQIWFQPGNGPMNIGNGSFPTSMHTNEAYGGHPDYNDRAKLSFRIKPLTTNGAEFWAILVRDNEGTSARSYGLVTGSDTGITARDTAGGTYGATSSTVQPVNGNWHNIDIIVDIREPDSLNKVYYYLDGVLFFVGTSDGGQANTDRIRQIDFWQYSPTPAGVEQKILIDDVRLGTAPGLPTNTITSPDSFATESPTITWDRTWPNCDITAIQVKVCETNDPNAAAVYDSGWVSGNATSQVTDAIAIHNQDLYVFQRDQTTTGTHLWSEGRVFQINIDPPAQPVITAPNGTVTTAKTYVEFPNANAHDSLQMKIFTSDVSDPETATAYYDTTVVPVTGNSIVTGTLANGSYWAFVKIHNVAGWSLWSSGKAFSVNSSSGADWVDVLQMNETVPDLLTWDNPGGTAAWTGTTLTDPTRLDGFAYEMLEGTENVYTIENESTACGVTGSNKLLVLTNAPGEPSGTSHTRSMRMHKCQDEIDLDRGVTFMWEMASIGEEKLRQHGGKTHVCSNVYVVDKDPQGIYRMVAVRCRRSSVGMVSNQADAMMTGQPDGPGFTNAALPFSEGFRRYRLTGRNQVRGDYDSTKWTLYVNDVETLTTTGTFVDGSYAVDFVALGMGESHVHGQWQFDWMAVNGGGDYAPGEWNPVPAAASTFPSIGAAKANTFGNRSVTINGAAVITKVATHTEVDPVTLENIEVQDGYYVQDVAPLATDPEKNATVSGLKIISADNQGGAVTVGAKVTSISGVLSEQDGGRAVVNPAVTIEGTAPYAPVAMSQKTLNSPCITQNLGSRMDTMGMLVRVFGRCTLSNFDPTYGTLGGYLFYVDDGSGVVDGREIIDGLPVSGIRCFSDASAPDAVAPSVGDYVMVEGIAGYEEIAVEGVTSKVRQIFLPSYTIVAPGG